MVHYVPPTATYLQYRVIGLTPMAVGLSQSLAQRSRTVSRISSRTRQSALTLSDVCWRRICLRDTSACSPSEIDNFMRYINLLTYCMIHRWHPLHGCWLTELRFNIPPDTKSVILEMLLPDKFLANTEWESSFLGRVAPTSLKSSLS